MKNNAEVAVQISSSLPCMSRSGEVMSLSRPNVSAAVCASGTGHVSRSPKYSVGRGGRARVRVWGSGFEKRVRVFVWVGGWGDGGGCSRSAGVLDYCTVPYAVLYVQ